MLTYAIHTEFLGPHPHITALLATCMDDKTPPNKCMLMEYAGKGSLDTVLYTTIPKPVY
jgi:hypothetical protein